MLIPTLREANDIEVITARPYVACWLSFVQVSAGVYSYLPHNGIEKLRRSCVRVWQDWSSWDIWLNPSQCWPLAWVWPLWNLRWTCTRIEKPWSQTSSWVQLTKKPSQRLSVILVSLTSNCQRHTKSNLNRDEKRPRNGLLRTREFIMKDLIASANYDSGWRSLWWSTRRPMSVSLLVVVWTSPSSVTVGYCMGSKDSQSLWISPAHYQILTVGLF